MTTLEAERASDVVSCTTSAPTSARAPGPLRRRPRRRLRLSFRRRDRAAARRYDYERCSTLAGPLGEAADDYRVAFRPALRRGQDLPNWWR